MSYQKLIGYMVDYRRRKSLLDTERWSKYVSSKNEMAADRIIEQIKYLDKDYVEIIEIKEMYKNYREIHVPHNIGLSVDNLRALKELAEMPDETVRGMQFRSENDNYDPKKIHSFKGQIKFVVNDGDIKVVEITDPGDPYNWGHVSKK